MIHAISSPIPSLYTLQPIPIWLGFWYVFPSWLASHGCSSTWKCCSIFHMSSDQFRSNECVTSSNCCCNGIVNTRDQSLPAEVDVFSPFGCFMHMHYIYSLIIEIPFVSEMKHFQTLIKTSPLCLAYVLNWSTMQSLKDLISSILCLIVLFHIIKNGRSKQTLNLVRSTGTIQTQFCHITLSGSLHFLYLSILPITWE